MGFCSAAGAGGSFVAVPVLAEALMICASPNWMAGQRTSHFGLKMAQKLA
jgi:hypothetical protein